MCCTPVLIGSQLSLLEGTQAVTTGTTTYTINLGSTLPNTNYFVGISIENTVDASPSALAFVISSKTTSSFDITLSAAPTSNYVIRWQVIV